MDESAPPSSLEFLFKVILVGEEGSGLSGGRETTS